MPYNQASSQGSKATLTNDTFHQLIFPCQVCLQGLEYRGYEPRSWFASYSGYGVYMNTKNPGILVSSYYIILAHTTTMSVVYNTNYGNDLKTSAFLLPSELPSIFVYYGIKLSIFDALEACLIC